MKRGKRLTALLLAVLVFTMSDVNLFQVLSMETVKEEQASDIAPESGSGENKEDTADVPENGESVSDPAVPVLETPNVQEEAPQKAPEIAPAVMPAQAPIPAAETEKNFDMEDSVTAVDTTGGINAVYAGDTYYYKIHYTVPPLGSGGDFLNPQISIELPQNVGILLNAQGNPDVTGQDVNYSSIRQNGRYLYIYLNKKLDVGTAKDITIGITTTNFKMINGTQIKLSPKFTAEADGQKAVGTVPEDKKAAVTIKADDGWTVRKSAGSVVKKDTSYEVPYTLEVQNTQNGKDAVWNRTGRLDMNAFLLTDVLPVNYPAGGGATKVLSVYMGTQELKENIDYTIEKHTDGYVKSIAIRTINKVTKEQEAQYQYVKEGTPVTTSYTVRLEYPRAPYITPSDAEMVKEYMLKNDAVLNYELLGEAAKTAQASAEIQLGEKEAAGAPQKIKVKKLIKFGETEFSAGSSAREYGTAEFALYKDQNGTIANNIDGTAAAGNPRETDHNGQVTFQNLRSGTYYLKETKFLTDFDTVASNEYIPIRVNGGIVSLGEGYTGPYRVRIDSVNNRVEVLNTSSKLGALVFDKHGTKPDGADEVLGGVSFQLKSKDGTTVYSATSDAAGRVIFHAVLAGAYTLQENSVGSNSNYEVSAKTYSVTVKAGEVTKPVLTEADGNGNAVFRNVSPKGYLKIKKVNEQLKPTDEVIGLTGAKFELYGPFETPIDVVPEGAVPVKDGNKTYQMVTGENGEAVSIALKKGHYILKEIQAPEGYVIKKEYTSALVVQNQVNSQPVVIENEKKIELRIKKEGVLGSKLYEEQLAGAVFHIYDAQTGGTFLGELKTYLDGTGASTSNPLKLKEGTYWYEEVAAPEGYAKAEGRTPFTLAKAKGDTWQLRVENTPSYGQLKVSKQDSYTKQPLAGVTFGIYTDAACTKPYLKAMVPVTMTTDAKGEAVSPLLPQREPEGYYVKETKTASGYQIADTVYGPYQIRANEQVLVNAGPVSNEKQVSIVMQKQDSITKTLLNGAVFKLYETETGQKEIKTGTTVNGQCTFSGLKPNTTYWYEETTVPQGYVAAGGRRAIVSPDYAADGSVSKTVTVENERKAKLMLHKTTDMDGNGNETNMPGVKFKVYEVRRGEVFNEASALLFGTTGVTGADGKVSIDGLNPQKDYYIVEVLPETEAGGYEPKVIGPVKPTPGMNQGIGYASSNQEIKNEAVKGKIQIEKISSIRTGSWETIPVKAVFDIYQGTYSNVSELAGKTPVGQLTTDAASGLGTSGWLNPGAYTLKEVSVTGDYTLKQTLYPVMVEKAATNKTLTGANAVVNVPKGKVAIHKKAVFQIKGGVSGAQSEYDLAGMQFDIYRKLTDNVAQDMTPANQVDTTKGPMSGSSWTSKVLDAGFYWIKELVPQEYSDQYEALPAFEVEVLPGRTVMAKQEGADGKSVLNRSKYGKIRLFKRDINNKVNESGLLDGAEFELYQEVTPSEGEKIEGGPDAFLKKIKATTSSDAAGEKLVSGTNGRGEAVTTALKPGMYYLKEIKAPAVYEMIDAWTGPIAVTEGKETQTDIFNYRPIGQEGIKRDVEGRPVAGAYAGVFKSEADANAMQAWLKEQKVGTGTEDYGALAGQMNNAAFRKAHNILSYGVSGANGKIKFAPALTPTKSYYIMELLPPKGYLWNPDIVKKTVKQDGSFDTPLVIVDASGSQIKVWKYTTLSGKETAVEGVSFQVYKAAEDGTGTYEKDGIKYKKEGTEVATGVSDASGSYITIYLPAGTYIIEEDGSKMPESVEFTEASTKYQIVTIADGQKKDKNSSPDARFYNPSKWAKFYVKKVDAGNTAQTLAATFQIYQKDASGTFQPYKLKDGKDYTITTNTDGSYLESIFLKPEEYQLWETKAPAGYTMLKEPIAFTIAAGEAAYVKWGEVPVNQDGDSSNDVVINWKQGSLVIEKYGYYQETGTDALENEEKLAGVKFSLYKGLTENAPSDCVSDNLVKSQISTGNDGKATIGNLDAGDYWLVETSSGNAKYPIGALEEQIKKAQKVAIMSGKATNLTGANKIINITNYGKIKLQKIDTVSKAPLAGAEFTVYTDANCSIPLKVNNQMILLKTDAGGEAVSVPIPAGAYWVKETKAPEGYKVDANAVRPVMVAESKTTNLTAAPFENGRKFKLQFRKQNLEHRNLAGAVLAIYDTQEAARKATNAVPGSVIDKGTTGADGTWTTKELTLLQQEKIYYLKELAAPAGYALPEGDAAIHAVTVTYQAVSAAGIVPVLSNLANMTVTNTPLGKVAIEKYGEWQGISETEKRQIPLSGVEFKLYPVSGDNVKHEANASAAATLTTGEDGKVQGPELGLKAGWYEVVERVPAGYADAASHWVQVKNNECNTVLTGAGAVKNYPDKGNFVLYKYDGSKNSTGTRTGLAGAEFMLYRKNETTGKYEPYDGGTGGKASFQMAASSYTSGMLKPGDYQIVETKAPEPYKYRIGETEYTVQFQVDATPIAFAIKEGTTIRVEAYNSPKGSIRLMKTGDAYNRNEPISVASFQLLNQDKKPIGGTVLTAGTNGSYLWENMAPGTYYVQELASQGLTDMGYVVNPNLLKVVVPEGKLVSQVTKPQDLTTETKMTDDSNKGRLRIIKRGEADSEKLTGAVFEIYAKAGNGTWETKPVDTVTVQSAEGTLSKLLPAKPAGTHYKIKEIKAPDGYTLDGTLAGYPLEREVLLYPYHNPSPGQNENTVTVKNKRTDHVTGFESAITKQIRENPSDMAADEMEYGNKTHASESLLLADYNVDYRIAGYADNGANETGAETFVITDNDVTYWYYGKDSTEPVALPIENESASVGENYQMNRLEILPAVNTDAGKKVGAEVFVQYTKQQKEQDKWIKLDIGTLLSDMSEGKSVSLTDDKPVIGVKVAYLNVEKGFKAEGIIINTTFKNRGAWSTEKDHEVREIKNTATLSWEDKRLGADGKPDHNKATVTAAPVIAYFPTYTAAIPQVSINNAVVSSKSTYYAGDTVAFRTTVTHHAVEDEQPVSFRQAVVSLKLPAFTALDEQKGTNGFTVYRMVNGVKSVIPPALYQVTRKKATASLNPQDPSGEETGDREDLNADLYTFEFTEDAITTLAEGEQLVLEYSGFVSYDRTKDVGKLVCPAYLSSNALVPRSAENPKGLSFTYSTEVEQELDDKGKDKQIVNDVVQKNLSYLNDTADVPIADSTSVRLLKEVSATDGNYSSSAIAKVNPDGTIYYKLTIYNLSSDMIKKASIVDVLPYRNEKQDDPKDKYDKYILPSGTATDGGKNYESRKTDIPLTEGYQPVTFMNASGEQDNVTFYYYDQPWESSNAPETGKIGMLYDSSKMADWTAAGWKTGVNEAAKASVKAVGAQIDFGTEGLEPGGKYTIKIQVKAPGYTAEKIEDYNGKLIANSAALAVVRSSASENKTEIGLDDRVEPNQVLATMALPTGSIGDYVWFDADNDGMQGGIEDKPVEGVPVELWQTRYYMVGDGAAAEKRQDTRLIGTVKTDQDGKYLFENLSCDYKKAGAADEENPFSYVGNEYYRYTVKFVIPSEYGGVTDTYKGSDKEKDSNIIKVSNCIGETEAVALHVQEDESGALIGEQNRSVDAGLIKGYALGNRVWLDRNENGIQDAGEDGVQGVSVSLYRVDGPNGRIQEGQQAVTRMLTDTNGNYKFTNLVSGHYVVRFDVSSLRKTGGYAYRYDFTKALKSELAGINNNDSDAIYSVDADGRIKDTDVIALTEEGLAEGSGADRANRYDPRWDAGLVVYSAISGFCFDDRDYNDVQGLMIPLPGTKVELYRIDLSGKEELAAEPQIVGGDGKYYFDHLTFMGESQKYKLKFTYPEGYEGVAANVGSDDLLDSDVNAFERTPEGKENRNVGYISEVTVQKDSIEEHWDAGARKYAAIGDYVWVDANRDGIQDASERPIAGIRVVLQKRENQETAWEYYAETATDEHGKYLFTGLKSSEEILTEYRVVFAFDPGTKVTITNAGQNQEMDSDAQGTYLSDIIPPIEGGAQSQGGFVTTYIKPGYAETDLSWDAGIIKEKVSVGDYVWYDDNYDGMQQPEEKGVPDVRVVLEYNPSGNVNDEAAWQVYAETRTDETGYYLFEDLNPGNYRLKFQVPDGYRATRYNRGTGENAGEVDSDAARGTGDGWYVSRTFYLDRDDRSWDAGIYKPKSRTEINRVPRSVDRVVDRLTNRVNRARTGDETQILLWAAAILLASVTAGILIYKKKKGKK